MGEKNQTKEIKNNNAVNKEFSSLYIPTAVFEQDSNVDETEEKAIMLSKAYQRVEREWNFRTKCLFMGFFYIITGIVIGLYLSIHYSNLSAGILAFIGLIFLGIAVLIYGIYIKKPCKIKSLSKIFHISYIIPYKSAILFDGSGVLTNKKIRYTDFKIDEIEKFYKKKESKLNFNGEKELVKNLKKMKNKILKMEKKEFFTPIIPSSGKFLDGLKEAIKFCEKGFPTTNLLDEGCSVNEAFQSLKEIREIEENEEIFEKIDELKKELNKYFEPFLEKINNNIEKIEDYLTKINKKLSNKFPNNKILKENNYNVIPYLNMHQKVINLFEEQKEDVLKPIINECSDAISTIRREGKRRKDEIKKSVDIELEKIDEKIEELEREVKIAYEKMIEEKRTNEEQKDEKENKAKEGHRKKVQELQSKKQEKEELKLELQNKFDEIDKENEIEIEKIRKKRDEKLVEARGEPLNKLIKNRDTQIGRVEKFKKLLEKEKQKHFSPFFQRKNLIVSYRDELFSSLNDIVKERNVLLSKIKDWEAEIDVEMPVKIAIPFWLLELEHAKDNIIIFPPFKLEGKIGKEVLPMFQFEEMKDYFINKEILHQARKFSIIGYITPSMEKALNSMIIEKIIPRKYFWGIKKMGGKI